jgi:hypothetical protein
MLRRIRKLRWLVVLGAFALLACAALSILYYQANREAEILAELSTYDSVVVVQAAVGPGWMRRMAIALGSTALDRPHTVGINDREVSGRLASLLSQLPSVKSFTFEDCTLAPLETARPMQINFEELSLTDCRGVNHWLPLLPPGRSLELLSLAGSDADESSIERVLKSVAALRHLNLDKCSISNGTLAALKNTAALEALWIGETNLTEQGFRQLKQFRSLKDFSAAHTAFKDDDLRYAAAFPLECLALDGTAISDLGAKRIGQMQTLRLLYLTDTKITDAGLMEFRGLRRLEILHVGGSQVTAKGCENLKRQLPHAAIDCRRRSP